MFLWRLIGGLAMFIIETNQWAGNVFMETNWWAGNVFMETNQWAGNVLWRLISGLGMFYGD